MLRATERVRDRRLPAYCHAWVCAVIMGGVMTAVVSATLTWIRGELTLAIWLSNWVCAWALAVPLIVWLGPRAKRCAGWLAVVPDDHRPDERQSET